MRPENIPDTEVAVGGYTHGKTTQEKSLNSIDVRLQRLRDKISAKGIDQDAAEVLRETIDTHLAANYKLNGVDKLIECAGNLMVLYMPKQEIKMNVGLVADLQVTFHGAATKEAIGQVIDALKFQQSLFPDEESVPPLNTPEKIIGALHEEAQNIRETTKN